MQEGALFVVSSRFTWSWWIWLCSCWGWRCRPLRRWTRTWCKPEARLSELWLPKTEFCISRWMQVSKSFRNTQNNRYDTIYLWSPTLRRQLNNVIVIHLENKKMSQTKSLFCHILIVNLNVSKLWWQKEHIHINMNLTSVLFMKTFTFTLGELLLTTLKMLTRQRRIVIRRPIRPATTWSQEIFFGSK